MMTRRGLMLGSVGAYFLARTPYGRTEDAHPLSTGAEFSSADELIALPGKKPLIKRAFRPPNFETPFADLRRPFTPNEAFFVRYHLAVIPEVDVRTWKLRVAGTNAQRPLEWSLAELTRNFEHVSVAAINQCSGNRRGLFTPRVPGVQWQYGAMGNALWSGVRLRDVLQKAGIAAGTVEVVFGGTDSAVLPATPDFVKSLPIERALDENTLIAFEMNGRPLPHWNGAPARLVVPGWTATYWMKHLTDIRIEPKPFDGFWMKAGYRIPTGAFPGARFATQETPETVPITDIMVNSLVTSHQPGSQLAHGHRTELVGWAWDNGAGIEGVEISLDGKHTWREAALDKDLGRFAWRGFRWALEPEKAGTLEIAVRARSRNGQLQPEKLTPNPSGYHHNAIQTLALEVA